MYVCMYVRMRKISWIRTYIRPSPRYNSRCPRVRDDHQVALFTGSPQWLGDSAAIFLCTKRNVMGTSSKIQ